MASWIVHLRLAEALLAFIPGLDEAAFAVGNIAPDSGVPDEKWEQFTPPPQVSHFQHGTSLPRDLADLEFYRRYLHPLAQLQDDPQRFSLLLGYFFHLVTDNLWVQHIALPTRRKFQKQFDADKDFIWQVKRDWYGLDFEYVRSHPQSLFWRVFLPLRFNGDYLGFMPLEAIQQRIAHIQTFYQRTDDEVKGWYLQHPGLYLTQAQMDTFVKEGAARLARVYDYLRQHERELEGRMSVMEVVA